MCHFNFTCRHFYWRDDHEQRDLFNHYLLIATGVTKIKTFDQSQHQWNKQWYQKYFQNNNYQWIYRCTNETEAHSFAQIPTLFIWLATEDCFPFLLTFTVTLWIFIWYQISFGLVILRGAISKAQGIEFNYKATSDDNKNLTRFLDQLNRIWVQVYIKMY